MFIYDWFLDETDETKTTIRIYGIDTKHKNICLHVNNFTRI